MKARSAAAWQIRTSAGPAGMAESEQGFKKDFKTWLFIQAWIVLVKSILQPCLSARMPQSR